MQITVQQYNAVVTGLRTQLELHRAKESEQRDTIHQLVSQVDRLNKEAEALTQAVKIAQENEESTAGNLVLCGRIAQGGVIPFLNDNEWVRRVYDLRQAYEAKLVELATPKPRKRVRRK